MLRDCRATISTTVPKVLAQIINERPILEFLHQQAYNQISCRTGLGQASSGTQIIETISF
jgi:hypothetical protein